MAQARSPACTICIAASPMLAVFWTMGILWTAGILPAHDS